MSQTIDLVKDSTMQDVVQAIREISGRYDLKDYKSIVAAIRAGHGDLIPNGTCFAVPHAVYGSIDFVTRRQNVDKVVGEPDRPTVTIQAKYCISANAGTSAAYFQYDRPEAFMKVAELIPAGSVCKFTATNYGGWVAGDYHFTAAEDIPVGAMLCISGYQNTALTSLNVQVFANQKATSASASYAISSGDGGAGVDLGAWESAGHNHPQRISYGSNNEAQSNIFQFLNGDSGANYMDSIWVPKTDFDMMCTSYTSLKGFLGGFPEDFRECLGLAAIHNITNNVFETDYSTGDEYTHNGYFWLPSRKEIYGSDETAKEASEAQFPYYANVGTANADKLGYAKGASSATTEWLRTPLAGSALHVRIVHAGGGGALDSSGAYRSYGVRPLAILA